MEGLIGPVMRHGAVRRKPRLFRLLCARAMSARYMLICMRARNTARLRVLAGKLDILLMLLASRLTPVSNLIDKAGYACGIAAASLSRAVRSFAEALRLAIHDALVFLPERRRAGRFARLNTSIVCCAFTVVFLALSTYGVGLEVIVDGTSLGFVSSPQDFDSAVDNVRAKASEILGRPYVMVPNPLYRFTLVNKKLIFNQAETEEILLSSISDLKQLYVLTVDGVAVAASQEYAPLRNTLDKKLSQYGGTEDGERVSFYQDVRIEQRLAAASLELPLEDIERMLLSEIRPETTHTVAEGDTVTSVANRYGLSESALLSLNPGLAPDDGATAAVLSMPAYTARFDDHGNPLGDAAAAAGAVLTPGTELKVGESIPFLSVCVTKEITYTDPIPFDTEYIDDTSMFEGDSRLVSDGANGSMQVTAELRFLNGNEVDRTILSNTVLTEPVAAVMAQGTRVRYALGTFIRPYSGVLTSGYGNRYLFGRWSFHSGIDLAGPKGDTIVASDGGKVISAGRQNGYGNLVIIDHQNGYRTAYAHCSKILVSVGQMVAQGEAIAKVGSTGVSTGPHLHFEIRTGDGTINPLNLIGK